MKINICLKLKSNSKVNLSHNHKSNLIINYTSNFNNDSNHFISSYHLTIRLMFIIFFIIFIFPLMNYYTNISIIYYHLYFINILFHHLSIPYLTIDLDITRLPKFIYPRFR